MNRVAGHMFFPYCLLGIAVSSAAMSRLWGAEAGEQSAKQSRIANEDEASTDRPNIVIYLTDDHTWHDAGAYGSDQVRTPHIDRLANEGMKFNYCFTATAMCATTRQQLWTGMYPVRNGAYPNHGWAREGTRSLPHHLGQLGYAVALVGKHHHGPPE